MADNQRETFIDEDKTKFRDLIIKKYKIHLVDHTPQDRFIISMLFRNLIHL